MGDTNNIALETYILSRIMWNYKMIIFVDVDSLDI